MAYPFKGNRADFFQPILDVAGTSTKPLASIDIGAANATHGEFICVRPCTMREAAFHVTLEAVVGTTTAPYVVLSKYGTPGAGGSATVIGSITVPTGTAVGKVVRKGSLSTAFAVGDVVQVKHVVGTGDAAGQGNVDWYCEPSEEAAGNNSDISTSST